MNKAKRSVAIPAPIEQWILKIMGKTGESFSAVVSRLLVDAKEAGRK